MFFTPPKGKKIILSLLFFLTIFFSFSSPVSAQGLPVIDAMGNALQAADSVWKKVTNALQKIVGKAGTTAINKAVSTAINTMAYDTATWIGSGAPGQKPLFIQEGWGKFLGNVGENAVGTFLEEFGKSNSIMKKYGINFCAPSLSVKFKIGLGLLESERPQQEPDCSFKTLQQNWTKFANSQSNYLKSLGNSFDINSNDLGAAVLLKAAMITKENEAVEASKSEAVAKQGWLDVRDIAGNLKTPPGEGKRQYDQAAKTMSELPAVDCNGGDLLVCAANVFLNQLAATGFKTLMKTLADPANPSSREYSGDYGGLANAESDSYVPGVSGVRESLKNMTKPRFDVRGDYDILAELSSCEPNENLGVGPTNCVIDEKLRQAIEGQRTVAEALESGLLKGKAIYGFKSGGQNPVEPSYLEGYPYRSLTILRKFRIIPVTWEIAAEYIQANEEVRTHANLEDLVACFDPKDSFKGYNDSGVEIWCEGLIDPRWVLKAPRNYCAKEGYGPQIIFSDVVEQGVDENNNKLPAQLVVSRLDNYCADEQSCIKENSDGSCEYYGYCTGERRKWRFDGEACDPIYNTCQEFSSEDGKKISYLKNTIDYCSSADYGCEKYASGDDASYSIATKAVEWQESTRYMYFNKGAEVCDSSSESCSQFIRISAGLGANLLFDGGFEEDPSWLSWPSAGSINIVNGAHGRSGKVMEISGAGSPGINSYDHSGVGSSVMPDGFVMEPEISYTLSADIYIETGDKVILSIGRAGEYWETIELIQTGSWNRRSVTIKNNKDILANQWRIQGANVSGAVLYYLDNVKFEVGYDENTGKSTDYSDYGADETLIYEKIIPNYLEKACYINATVGDYRLKDNPPAECYDFARKCNRDEAGCDIFKDSFDGIEIPAKVGDSDYCTEECVGYDSYVQESTEFISAKKKYLIPSTSGECNAESVGCEEFTDLDESMSGAEKKVYFSYLRQCVKPDSAGSTCAPFYSWQGDSDGGQQLITYQLSADGDEPEVTIDDSLECNPSIYNLSPLDSGYNPDCREFYNRDGEVSYHLYNRTISCTEDCHPFRLTRKNEVAGATTASACGGLGGHWNNEENKCYTCENGGTWSDQHQSCLYNAVPKESNECEAEKNGCKEYNGNQGGNTKRVFVDYFEDENNGGWTGGSSDMTAVVVGERSYRFTGLEIKKNVGNTNNNGVRIHPNSAYVISFLAKGASGGSLLGVYFDNGVEQVAFDSVTVSDKEWQLYRTSLSNIDHAIADDERLIISGEAGVLIDNIRLTEITDRYFLIDGSWKTPDICDADVNGNPYPYYMAGCSKYTDRLGNTRFLHSFSYVCQDSAAGCEAVIDTSNSVSLDQLVLNQFSPAMPDTKADQVAYISYDPKKACNPADKGCQRLGLAKTYEDLSIYRDIYLKNDPDKYSTIACDENGVGCDRWKTSEGDFYFKDPGDMVCEYRQAGDGSGWDWFKKKVKRCTILSSQYGEGSVCLSDQDCELYDGSTGHDSNSDNYIDCLVEEKSDPCPTDKLKTIGFGGQGNEIYQPASSEANNWVGICPTSQSGCTEYIDPMSESEFNLISNPDFSRDLNTDNVPDGWVKEGGGIFSQSVSLESGYLYLLDINTTKASNLISIGNPSSSIAPFNVLEGSADAVTNILANSPVNYLEVKRGQNLIFYLNRNYKDKIFVNNGAVNNGNKVTLKKIIVDYQLINSIDKNSCGGIMDPLNGCVLFNERAHNGSDGLSELIYEAEQSYADSNGNTVKCTANVCDNNANQIIKVRPDRVCNEWLACKSYIKDNDGQNVCFDIGECNRLDEFGECANFAVNATGPQNNEYIIGSSFAPDFANMTGYAKAGFEDYYTNFKKQPNDLFDFGDMEQIGRQAIVQNGNFELYNNLNSTSTPGKPSGWEPASWEDVTSTLFSVVADPVTAQRMGISYPVEGGAFLKYNAGNQEAWPVSSNINVVSGEIYDISLLVNTEDLKGGSDSSAIITIIDADTGNPLKEGSKEINIRVLPGRDWHVKLRRFKSSTNSIRIILGAENGSSGKIYIDDVRISPVLSIRENPQWDLRQTCKLYPEDDSLSCEYYEDSGIYRKGEYGYCLEYDRYPGNPEACLLWWPVDKVTGTGLEDDVDFGYNSEGPLYYCIGGPSESEIRPYFDASSMAYMVDEDFSIKVNGVSFTKKSNIVNSSDDRKGYLSDHLNNSSSIVDGDRVYLNYGTNVIDITFVAKSSGGVSFLQMVGDFYYYDQDNNYKRKSGHFNLSGDSRSGANTTEVVSIKADHGDQIEYGFGIDGSYRLRKFGCRLIDAPSWDFMPEFGASGSIDDVKYHWIVSTKERGDGDTDDCDEDDIPGDSEHITLTINIPQSTYPCYRIARVSTIDNENKAWAERLAEGSSYSLDCNSAMPDFVKDYFSDVVGYEVPNSCNIQADYTPFGSLVYPADGSFSQDLNYINSPELWAKMLGGNPLIYRTASGNDARMGQLQSISSLQGIFFQSYGVWKWDKKKRSYVADDYNWYAPLNLCANNVRGQNETCAVRPDVVSYSADGIFENQILLNGKQSLDILGSGFVNLTFNSKIDSEQAPLRSYEVDWGDGETLVVSTAGIKSRPDKDSPHSAFHFYSYEKLVVADTNNDLVDCPPKSNYCTALPRVKIRDNWDWCSEGRDGIPCPSSKNAFCANDNPAKTITGISCVASASDYGLNSDCPSATPICMDGWEEPNGVITVFNN